MYAADLRLFEAVALAGDEPGRGRAQHCAIVG